MTARNLRALAAVVISVSLCAVLLALQTRSAAAEARARAEAEHAAVASSAARLARLSATAELIDDRPRAEPDLVARLTEQLTAAGAGAGDLTRVSSGEPASVAGQPYKRQTTTLTIERITPQIAARFLVGWREAEPLWVVRALTLQRTGGRRGEAPGSFTLILTLENVYLSETAGPEASS